MWRLTSAVGIFLQCILMYANFWHVLWWFTLFGRKSKCFAIIAWIVDMDNFMIFTWLWGYLVIKCDINVIIFIIRCYPTRHIRWHFMSSRSQHHITHFPRLLVSLFLFLQSQYWLILTLVCVFTQTKMNIFSYMNLCW